MMRALAALLLAGCFGPSLADQPFKCGSGGECPPDYQCDSITGFCVKVPGSGIDAPMGGAADARIDGPPGTADARLDAPMGGPIDARFDGPIGVIDAPMGAADARDAPPGTPDAFSCQPGAFLGCASPTSAILCNQNGDGTVIVSCPGGCDPTAMQCFQCTPNTTTCQGDDLITCDQNGMPTTTHCPVGCTTTGGSGAACLVLIPSNLPENTCRPGPVDILLEFTQDITINTDSNDSCTSVGLGPPTCIIRASQIIVNSGVTVRFIGARTVALVGTHGIQVDGIIDVGAEGSLPGAGATRLRHPLGNGQFAEDPGSASGGGGGGAGHATDGGTGGTGGNGSKAAGGGFYGGVALTPIEAGAFGGGGGIPLCSIDPCPSTPGGAGGGALQIVACEELVIGPFGIVTAGGGGGKGGAGGNVLAFPAPSGGGGGGAGGGILIEAPSLHLPAAGFLWAPGGGGGGGGGIGLEQVNGPPGDDGLDAFCDNLGCTFGDGGAGGGGTGGNGGNGGSGDVPDDGTQGAAASGGGGGGATGRIRINTRPGSADVDGTAVPTPSLGTIQRQR